jgi:hypothetical protein
MGRLCSLLENNVVRDIFREKFKLVGNNPRICRRRVPDIEDDHDAIRSQLDGLNDLSILNRNWVKSKIRHIDSQEMQIHLLVKMIPVSIDNTGAFLSFRDYECGYWSQEIEDMVFAKLLGIQIGDKDVSDLLPWGTPENQALIGYAMKRFIHALAKELPIIASTTVNRNIIWIESKSKFMVENVRRNQWTNPVVLFNPVPWYIRGSSVNDAGREVAQTGRSCYFRPSLCVQALYDAVIIPSDPTAMIDVIQITVGERHFVLAEFANLFGLRPGWNWGDPPDFRLLVIRPVHSDDQVEVKKKKPLLWNFIGDVAGFRERVLAVESIFVFRNAVAQYRLAQQ